MGRKFSIKCDGLNAVVKLDSALSSQLWVYNSVRWEIIVRLAEDEVESLAQLIPCTNFLILHIQSSCGNFHRFDAELI